MPDTGAPTPNDVRLDNAADRFHGTDDDFDPPADIPTTVAPDLETARHAEAFASAQAAVARFRALSDAAGNPGAPTPAGHTDPDWFLPRVWSALARDTDLGPPSIPELVHRIDDPVCGPAEVHAALWRLVADGAVAPDDAGERFHLLVHPDPAPGPGVADIAAVHPGETLATGLNRIGVQLAEIRALLAGRTVVHAAATQAQAQARYDRTLSAMDRVTQTDAIPVIAQVLANWVLHRDDQERVDTIAAAIAEALYGPTTEGDDHDHDRQLAHLVDEWGTRGVALKLLEPLDDAAALGLLDALRRDVLPDEGAPTEGDRRGRGPLIPPENWTSTDAEADDT